MAGFSLYCEILNMQKSMEVPLQLTNWKILQNMTGL